MELSSLSLAFGVILFFLAMIPRALDLFFLMCSYSMFEYTMVNIIDSLLVCITFCVLEELNIKCQKKNAIVQRRNSVSLRPIAM